MRGGRCGGWSGAVRQQTTRRSSRSRSRPTSKEPCCRSSEYQGQGTDRFRRLWTSTLVTVRWLESGVGRWIFRKPLQAYRRAAVCDLRFIQPETCVSSAQQCLRRFHLSVCELPLKRLTPVTSSHPRVFRFLHEPRQPLVSSETPCRSRRQPRSFPY